MEKLKVIFCSFCHNHWNTFNDKSTCKKCGAPYNWFENEEYIKKWEEKKLPFTLKQYMNVVNDIKNNGFSFFPPHSRSSKSFEDEQRDYPLTNLDIYEMIENNMELLVDAICNGEPCKTFSDVVNSIPIGEKNGKQS